MAEKEAAQNKVDQADDDARQSMTNSGSVAGKLNQTASDNTNSMIETADITEEQESYGGAKL